VKICCSEAKIMLILLALCPNGSESSEQFGM
jgi:hypothetical protein